MDAEELEAGPTSSQASCGASAATARLTLAHTTSNTDLGESPIMFVHPGEREGFCSRSIELSMTETVAAHFV